jgi:hypothetical protein
MSSANDPRYGDCGDQCIPVRTVIDQRYRGIFKFDRFNHMQSHVLDLLLNTNENVVVAAPTGTAYHLTMKYSIFLVLFYSSL